MTLFPTSRSEAESWLHNFIQSQDSLDAARATKVYATDATFRFANYPVVQGAKNIEDMVSARFAKLDMIQHVPQYFDLTDSRLWAAFNVTYRVKGDQAMENFLVPCVCVFILVADGAERGKIEKMEVYMDQNAVGERMEKVAKSQAV